MRSPELSQTKTTFSFEIFPPKKTTEKHVIYETLDALSNLHPDFISVTYGAGGSMNCENTVEIASAVKQKYGMESIAHLPCLYLSKAEIGSILEKLQENGISNILALRGDHSVDKMPVGEFHHANELIAFLHKHYPQCNLFAACYPEGHPDSTTPAADLTALKWKMEAGASQFITQLFLDNDIFYAFRERAVQAGISIPITAGIMPVTNKKQMEHIVKQCKITLPKKFLHIISKYEDNPEALRDAGIAYAIEQIVDLIAQDVDGIHLYTMNRADIAKNIYDAVFRLL